MKGFSINHRVRWTAFKVLTCGMVGDKYIVSKSFFSDDISYALKGGSRMGGNSIQCPKCGNENDASAIECDKCGVTLSLVLKKSLKNRREPPLSPFRRQYPRIFPFVQNAVMMFCRLRLNVLNAALFFRNIMNSRKDSKKRNRKEKKPKH